MKNWKKFLKNISTRIVVDTISVYQKILSPDHGIFKNVFSNYHCRFYPSCSEYAVQSIRQYGLPKGVVFSLLRILKCNPFNKGGYDPIL